jgi:hypothetical protein
MPAVLSESGRDTSLRTTSSGTRRARASSSRTSGAPGRLSVVPASSVCPRPRSLAVVRGCCCTSVLYSAGGIVLTVGTRVLVEQETNAIAGWTQPVGASHPGPHLSCLDEPGHAHWPVCGLRVHGSGGRRSPVILPGQIASGEIAWSTPGPQTMALALVTSAGSSEPAPLASGGWSTHALPARPRPLRAKYVHGVGYCRWPGLISARACSLRPVGCTARWDFLPGPGRSRWMRSESPMRSGCFKACWAGLRALRRRRQRPVRRVR